MYYYVLGPRTVRFHHYSILHILILLNEVDIKPI